MATLYATQAKKRSPAQGHGYSAAVYCAYGTYTVTAALALNDVIEMVRIPAGARIIGCMLEATDLDTGGSPAIVLDVGDGSDTDRLIDGATIGQAGGVTTTMVATGTLYQYTSEDTIDVLVQVAPATGATSGTIELAVWYILGR